MRWFLLFIILLSPTCSSAETKRYEIKSGVIEYKLDGRDVGTRTLYFDDYGQKEMTLTDSYLVMDGRALPRRLLMHLIVDNYSYSIDLEKKTAVKMKKSPFGKNDLADVLMKSILEANEEFAKEYAEEIFKQKEVLGTEIILGRTCELVKSGFDKICKYKGIVLKVYTSYSGGNIIEAIRFDENVEIPREKFEVPPDITITGELDHRKMMEGLFSAPE